MKIKYITFFLFSILFLFTDCNNKKTEKKVVNNKRLKEALIEANKHSVKSEKQNIMDYVRQHKLEMKKTGSGLMYMIYHHGNDTKIKVNDTITMNYEVQLLSGKTCYSSELSGVRKCIVGKAYIEKGLDEGILLLNFGAKAKFILPSHLAFGLAGDLDKIPPKSTLIYDVEIIGINSKSIN
ncbi:MAG: FKBP-type peptidyl-prolyl cis-trans isomerase [Bacteroidales bacterium]|nr:FKBP-type peptidyl-prolyl cis-trans isomerase [Bacteroidales bacterium]